MATLLDSYQKNKASLSGSGSTSTTSTKTSGSLIDSYKANKIQVFSQPTRAVTPTPETTTTENKPTNIIQKAKNLISNVVSKVKESDTSKFLSKVKDTIEKELSNFEIIKPAYAPAEEESTQTISTGKKIENRTVEQLVKEYQISPLYEKNRKSNIFIGNMFKGLTGGIINPKLEASTNISDKVIATTGEILGSITAMKTIDKGVHLILTKTGAVATLVNKYPKFAKWAIPFIENATTFDIYGQLDPEVKDRFKKLAQDTILAVPFTIIGTIPKAKFSVPASFGLGFGMAKLGGADNEDAFIAGSILAILDGAGRLSRQGNINKQVADKIVTEESLNVLNEYSGSKLGKRSSKTEIRKAYIKAVKKYHPDVGGNPEIFKTIASAYEFLSGKSIAPQFYEKQATGPKPETVEAKTGKELVKTEKALAKTSVQKGLTAPIGLLVSHEGSPDKAQVEKYKEQIKSGGEPEPIKVIREGEKYGIEDGKHRYQAYKELGIKEVPIELVEAKKPITKSSVSQQSISDAKKPVKIKPKVLSVPREQIPVGKGKEKVSKLEARVKKSLETISQETIDKLGLSTYKQMNKKENISKASKYVVENPEDAMKVLRGDIEAPKGILRNSIYVAMQNMAEGDVDLARKLATMQSTRFGQEISILTEIDPDSPVKVMSNLVEFREKSVTRRTGRTIQENVKKEVAEIKKQINKPSKYDWNEFIKSIEC